MSSVNNGYIKKQKLVFKFYIPLTLSAGRQSKSILLRWLILYAFVHLVGASDNTQSAKWRIVWLSSCRPFTSDNTPKHQTFHCRFVFLSLAKHTQRNVVVQGVVAMSPYCLAYKPILRFEPSDNVTLRQHAAQQHAVWRSSLATGRQDESPTSRRFTLCRVVASAN
jgi:hypothetical protein